MYASPVWYRMTTVDALGRLTSLENLPLKIICPGHDSYEERLSALNIISLATFLDKSCTDYARKVGNPAHCNNKLLQPIPSTLRRSARLKQRQTDTKCSSALRSSTVLMKYSNAGCINYKE